MQYPRKIYSIDNGLITIAGTEDLGRICENTVATELYRKQMDTYYWKSKNGEEVDFIIKNRNKLKAIQVSYNIEGMDTKKREIKALVKCMDELNLKTAEIITFDYQNEEMLENKKIIYRPLWKFLLDIS